jgi:hypothetical protein
MLANARLDRRTMLRGLGTAIALPLLDAMRPRLAVAGLTPATPAPLRFGVVYVPNGMNMKHWTPAETGRDYTLPSTLEPIAAFRDRILVLTGLTCDKARPNGDGGGDHARAMSAFLTGRQPKKTAGADIRAGVSVDQLIARHVGQATRFPSLEIGCEGGRQAGACDTGYSCAYSSTVSWRTETTPVPKETNPQLVFDRLFGRGAAEDQAAARAKRDLYNKSVLDLVAEDAKRLEQSLGTADRRKLDEYLTSVRELEQRVSRGGHSAGVPKTDYPRPEKEYRSTAEFPNLQRTMADLLVLAWQTDQTRVTTFVFANEGSTRSYPFIDVPDGHHDISHHQNNETKLQKIARIDKFNVSQFAYLLGKLKAASDGDGSLLDHCMVLYGSGNSDGNRHNHDDLPILLAGGGNGTLSPGRHVRYAKETPITNLYIEILARMNITVDRFGDSTGPLKDLKV